MKIRDSYSLYNISEDANKIDIEIRDSGDTAKRSRANQSCQIFRLQEIYQHHAKDAFALRRALQEESNPTYQKIFSENFKELQAVHDYAFSYRNVGATDEPLVKFRQDIEGQFRE